MVVGCGLSTHGRSDGPVIYNEIRHSNLGKGAIPKNIFALFQLFQLFQLFVENTNNENNENN